MNSALFGLFGIDACIFPSSPKVECQQDAAHNSSESEVAVFASELHGVPANRQHCGAYCCVFGRNPFVFAPAAAQENQTVKCASHQPKICKGVAGLVLKMCCNCGSEIDAKNQNGKNKFHLFARKVFGPYSHMNANKINRISGVR